MSVVTHLMGVTSNRKQEIMLICALIALANNVGARKAIEQFIDVLEDKVHFMVCEDILDKLFAAYEINAVKDDNREYINSEVLIQAMSTSIESMRTNKMALK